MKLKHKQAMMTILAGAVLLGLAGWLITFPKPTAQIGALVMLVWGIGGVVGGLAQRFRRNRPTEKE